MSSLSVFSFESNEVRTLGTALEPLFVGLDICKILEISNSRDALERLDEDERLMSVITTSGQGREMTVINESGLWSLVLTSRKPQAKRFKKWLTSEVIPAIRKTGTYSTKPVNSLTLIDTSKLDALTKREERLQEMQSTCIQYSVVIVHVFDLSYIYRLLQSILAYHQGCRQ